jgi:putative oxidoreductase
VVSDLNARAYACLGPYVQRLFSTFASGWPGRGLLLQRLLIAAVLFHCAIAQIGQPAPIVATVLHFIGTAAGTLLLLGLWTPVAGVLVAVTEFAILMSNPSDPWVSILLLVLGATLAMLGPGAWSLDARLFGRKQIDISS